ncbi:hypothetical protein [Arthrobacter sp. Y81]|uniref:hypothetical protein n=1 Tax=Arthrobacter sp. Y81 TaxID=2058897 RepID=UPI0021588274|nr:hypothetical protein [Arthrobacter sp. Y81]
MGKPTDLKNAVKTWQTMVDSNQALLLRKSGHDAGWWAERGREAGLKNDSELRDWMRDEHGITGYAQYAVSWEMFGVEIQMRKGYVSLHSPRRKFVEEVDDEVLGILAKALRQNS